MRGRFDSPGRVRVSLHDDFHASFRTYHLSDPEFQAYRSAMDGARYVRSLRASIATLDRVPAILVRLRKAGLGVGGDDMDARLRTALQERAATQDWLDLDAVKDRLERIEKSLEKKGERLFAYQRVGAQWLARGHGRLLADEMGLGKTVQALVALPANAAVVIVSPSAVKGEWKAQIARWRPSLRATILKGRSSFRWPAPGEAVILNYDILPEAHDREGVKGRRCNGFLPPERCAGCSEKVLFAGQRPEPSAPLHRASCDGFAEPLSCPGCHPFLEQCPPGAVIVVDEAQNVKNMQSIRHRRMCSLTDVVRAGDGYVWFLTGTPVENEPNELWAILRAGTIHEEAFGSWERFTRVFRARRLQSGGYEWGLPGEEIRAHLRRVMLRRLQRDVQSQLPAKLRKIHEMELDDVTYTRVGDMLAGSGKTLEEIIALLERDEIGFEYMSGVRAALATAKIPRLLEIVEDHEERGVPLIVFSDHRAPIDAVAKRTGWVLITGGESSEQKTRAKDEFQNGFLAGLEDRMVIDAAGVRRKADANGRVMYPKGIGLTIKAGGSGITLTRASHMIFVDRAWNPQANAQAEKRFDRIGQTAASLDIMDIVSNHPLDARVNAVIVRKMKLFEASINAAAERGTAGGEEELMKELREEQAAIAGGRAVRRGAKNGRERGAWEALHTLVFDDVCDERIAAEIAEQADTIGLSDKQWSLAIVITRKGRRQDEPPRVEVAPPPVVVPPPPPPPPPPPAEATRASTVVPEPRKEAGSEARQPSERVLSPRERRRLEWLRR